MHLEFLNKDTNYFRLKVIGPGKPCLSPNIDAVEASYLMVLKIAKAVKLHTIAEKSILPAIKDIVRFIIVEEFVNKLNGTCISNDTVHRRIADVCRVSIR
ncbi:Zinc finger BED domain-containing protein 5 [Thelohanellus kitauei]|uniref:Zinc finger BED domain-containing protein 5 n=1 Tax=Thelohanellus kitauei TaxID=669202 RepID=A0A0C2MVL2_THEKT|nr:Zinc finger BED domain-containing protein 5 [Thelohanellus kitauei]